MPPGNEEEYIVVWNKMLTFFDTNSVWMNSIAYFQNERAWVRVPEYYDNLVTQDPHTEERARRSL
jgi:hypothetical protein